MKKIVFLLSVANVEFTKMLAIDSEVSKGFTVIELLIVIAIVGILAAVAIPIWNNHNDQPIEVLKTKDWQCLGYKEREYTYPILVGKVWIMQTGRREECVQWKRRDG